MRRTSWVNTPRCSPWPAIPGKSTSGSIAPILLPCGLGVFLYTFCSSQSSDLCGTWLEISTRNTTLPHMYSHRSTLKRWHCDVQYICMCIYIWWLGISSPKPHTSRPDVSASIWAQGRYLPVFLRGSILMYQRRYVLGRAGNHGTVAGHVIPRATLKREMQPSKSLKFADIRYSLKWKSTGDERGHQLNWNPSLSIPAIRRKSYVFGTDWLLKRGTYVLTYVPSLVK